jgi:hypothetical protein
VNEDMFLKLNGPLHDSFCSCRNRLPDIGIPLLVGEEPYLKAHYEIREFLCSAMLNPIGRLVEACKRRIALEEE